MLKKILKILILASIIALITAMSVKAAFVERGYFAVGSEWVIAPAVVLGLPQLVKWVCEILETAKNTEGDGEDDSRN